MKVLALLVLVVACTRPNPAVCCLDEADCGEVGLGEVRSCDPGLACVDHQCALPSCAEAGCAAALPVCNVREDVCEGCGDSSDCSRFAGMDVCDVASGACVECVAASDCEAGKPICDGNTCRGCKLDSECSSGACGDDGACVAESEIVYLDPGGNDTGGCTRAAPCRKLEYAVSQTATTRDHLVLAKGAYVENAHIRNTTAVRLYIHGGGATLTPGNDENSVLYLHVPTTVRDLHVSGPGSNFAITLYTGPHLLERIDITGQDGIAATSAADIRDYSFAGQFGTALLLSSGAQVNLERAVLHGGRNGIASTDFGNAINMTNVLIWGTAERAIDLPNTGGYINSTTIVDSGTDSGIGPRAVLCTSSMTIRSSIIWAPGTVSRVPVQGCNLVSTIAGPMLTPGASNSDPLFVDAVGHDYHLKPSSPARDAVDTGPATDFEGDPRPRGARFDIGADEAP